MLKHNPVPTVPENRELRYVNKYVSTYCFQVLNTLI